MSDSGELAAKRALNVSAFARLKDLVRELEDGEMQHGKDFVNAEVEFKLNPSEVAWFVAYKTLAESLRSSPSLRTRFKD